MALIEIEHLSFSYPRSERLALDDVSMAVEAGAFVLLCGQSGCGKSTLLRHLKTALAPYGRHGGEVRFDGRPVAKISQGEQTERIGFVSQSPDNQIVTDKVWHELAFGLESLGLDSPTIRRRVAEMASFFGIQNWYNESVLELSGGQKQILNLASVMVMQPDLLILDEPTSQLDPIAASEFFATLAKINSELGCTIMISEQRLEEILPLVDKVFVLDGGRLLASGKPPEIGALLEQQQSPMLAALPTPMRMALALEPECDCPVTVREGRQWITEHLAQSAPDAAAVPAPDYAASEVLGITYKTLSLPDPGLIPIKTEEARPGTPVLSMNKAWFRYDKDGVDILRGLSLDLGSGELLALVGGNGSGKSTALAVLSGLRRPYRGKVYMAGRRTDKTTSEASLVTGPVKPGPGGLILLPQDPQTVFVQETVRADLLEMLGSLPPEQAVAEVWQAAAQLDFTDLLDRHPYDLSGGEQQRAALAKVLLAKPSILLLDEPTKGLDARRKEQLGALLVKCRAEGMSILMVSHDIEFCALFADRCALFFNGDIVSAAEAREFFAGNSFYTTAANRMARKLIPGAVVTQDIIDYIREEGGNGTAA
ncbi:MAG: ATP-binding cassette domain-containing protein [Coriobacteriia bacterium]|nr:ATP-binding cassette domain-containing protein [Coriobacteriia bacterium]